MLNRLLIKNSLLQHRVKTGLFVSTHSRTVSFRLPSLQGMLIRKMPSGLNLESSNRYSSLVARISHLLTGSTDTYADHRWWKHLGSGTIYKTISSLSCYNGKPLSASPVYERTGLSENMEELSPALHYGHKTGDGNYLSFFTDHGAYLDQNFFWDQNLRPSISRYPSFRVVSTLSTVWYPYASTWMWGWLIKEVPFVKETHAASNLKVLCLYDSFLAITPRPGMGIMRTEM